MSSVRRPNNSRSHGFTLIELLVILGIVVILASIFVPYALKLREENRRVECRDRLQQIFQAMQAYARVNGDLLPAAGVHDLSAPLVVFDDDPSVPNNVTASLWLLVRGGYVRDASVFLCPSGGGTAATVDLRRFDFPSPQTLGYSYAAPFGGVESYRLTEFMRSGFVVLADINPGDAGSVPHDAPLLDYARVNSPSHRRAGQNVLYPYGSAEWHITPYCGMNNDNIYTVRGDRGSTQPTSRPSNESGVTDLSILPTAPDDSFLLPVYPSP